MRLNCVLLLLAGACLPATGQWWEVPAAVGELLSSQTEGKWRIGMESRARYETRTGNAFGKDTDVSAGLIRTRVSLSYQPASWFRISGMLQDSRAPWYGANAPGTVRDPVDLQGAYFEIRPGSKSGFGMSAGRRMLNYGEGRLIGSPQWGNLSRTFDHARVWYGLSRVHLEFLVVSPVKIRIGEFNRPVLGDRVWGAYATIEEIFGKNLLEAYALRHDQNRAGGFSGIGRLSVNTYGARLASPPKAPLGYNLEVALQNGAVGTAQHRAAALDGWMKRCWQVADRPLEISAEYKFASRSFDQLYAANHDKFGHEDLFGWRNLHNARSLATYGVSKAFALNFMYDSFWLASAREALYSGSGKWMLCSPAGVAGRHVGEEADLFATYSHKHLLLGAGYGHLFAGRFVRATSPGASPAYVYIFHTYSF